MSEETKQPEEVKEEVVKTTPEIAEAVVEEVKVELPPVPEVVKVESVPVVEEVKVDIIEKVAVEKSDEEARKEMQSLLIDNENLVLAETALQNNEVTFEVKGATYRVRKTNFAEKTKANKFRMKRFVELLKDEDVILQKDLVLLYKNKGIDIDGMNKQVLELDSQQKALMIELGQAIKQSKSKPELEKYKEEIISITTSIQGINQEKQQLLEFSLENRILMEVYSYMIWLIAEKKVGETWVQIWDSYEGFLSSNDAELLGQVTKLGAVVVTEDMTNGVRM